MVEVERKYELPRGFRLPDLTQLPGVAAVDPAQVLALNACYFDTARLDLLLNRVTLRRRDGGHDAGWHLKRPAGSARRETQLPVTDGMEIPDELVDQVGALLHGRPLLPAARIHTRRTERALRDSAGTVLALVADDTVLGQRRLEPPSRVRWRELEVELADGPADLFVAIERLLVGAGARRSSSASKFARTVGEPDPAPPKHSHSSRTGRTLVEYLRAQRDQLRREDALARGGDVDGVHDMRVATRRLRSTLKTYARLLDVSDGKMLDGELAWLADTLGAVRDRDVLTENLLSDIARHAPSLLGGPVTDRIRRRLSVDHSAARADLVAALDSQRYRDLRDALDRAANEAGPDAARRRLYAMARASLRSADRRLDCALDTSGNRKAGHRDAAVHAARKAYKRSRYAIDVLIPLAGRPARRLAAHIGEIQDALGAHQDAVVAAALLNQLSEEAQADGESSAPYGLLYKHQRAIAAHQRRAAAKLYRSSEHSKLCRWLKV
jgi:CHAD domain-containing protein